MPVFWKIVPSGSQYVRGKKYDFLERKKIVEL